MTSKTFNLCRDQDWQFFLDWLLPQRDNGTKLTVKVSKYQKRRSSEANRYYFGVCVKTLAEELGNRIDEMHDIILMEYFGTETKTIRGHAYTFPKRRTTSPETISSFEFVGLVQCAQQIAAELGIRLPDQELDASPKE